MKIPAATINRVISDNPAYRKQVETIVYIIYHAFEIHKVMLDDKSHYIRVDIRVNGNVKQRSLKRQEIPLIRDKYYPFMYLYLLSFIDVAACARLVKNAVVASDRIPIDTKYIGDLITEVVIEHSKNRLNDLSNSLCSRVMGVIDAHPGQKLDFDRVIIGEKFAKAKPLLNKVYKMGLTESEIISILRYFSMKNRKKI